MFYFNIILFEDKNYLYAVLLNTQFYIKKWILNNILIFYKTYVALFIKILKIWIVVIRNGKILYSSTQFFVI
jgi:hypothetical protein